jgi:hypothetical protein
MTRQQIIDDLINGKMTKLQAIDRLETILYNYTDLKIGMDARAWRNQLIQEMRV